MLFRKKQKHVAYEICLGLLNFRTLIGWWDYFLLVSQAIDQLAMVSCFWTRMVPHQLESHRTLSWKSQYLCTFGIQGSWAMNRLPVAYWNIDITRWSIYVWYPFISGIWGYLRGLATIQVIKPLIQAYLILWYHIALSPHYFHDTLPVRKPLVYEQMSILQYWVTPITIKYNNGY